VAPKSVRPQKLLKQEQYKLFVDRKVARAASDPRELS